MTQAAKTHDIYVLTPDLTARGLDGASILEGVRPVDYDRFVDLTADKGTVQSWL